MTDNFTMAIQILAKNTPNVLNVVDKLGGVGAVLSAMPDLLQIARTVNQLNADNPATAVPLQYGTQTEAEITAFQKAHGLDDDGIFGDATWRVCKKLLKIPSA